MAKAGKAGKPEKQYPSAPGPSEIDTLFELLLEALGMGDTSLAAEYMAALEQLLALQAGGVEYMSEEEQQLYEERLQEAREYGEQMELERQWVGQELSWQAAAEAAPGRGAYNLQSRLPGYMPGSVSEALLKWGRELGAGYDPAWPGGTELHEAQETPTGMDWVDYIIQREFPGYILR